MKSPREVALELVDAVGLVPSVFASAEPCGESGGDDWLTHEPVLKRRRTLRLVDSDSGESNLDTSVCEEEPGCGVKVDSGMTVG